MTIPASERHGVVFVGCAFAAKYRLGGGNFSVPLQWMRGLVRLGIPAVWLEVMPASGDADADRQCIQAFEQQLVDHGLGDRFVLLYGDVDDEVHALETLNSYGRSREELRHWLRGPNVLLNLCYSIRAPLLLEFERRILCDLDPGEMSYWMPRVEMGQSMHHEFWTIGLNRNVPDNRQVAAVVPWKTFFPLVDTELYRPARRPSRARFTTVGQWDTLQHIEVDGAYPDLSKRARFDPYLRLPRAVAGGEFEMAMNLSIDAPDRARLAANGWSVVDPHVVVPGAREYREYIAGSLAEFTVCKGGDVLLRTGWLSDRSAAYLATARPVIMEDTGVSAHLPPDCGLFAVTGLDEARDAAQHVIKEWDRLARCAREMAVDMLDAGRTLQKILG